MKNNFQYKIKFSLNEPFNIDRIKNACRRYPNARILVEVQNTKGITSSMIRELNSNVGIRIAGAYDDDRLSKYQGMTFDREDVDDYYYNSVIYTRNEAVKILEEIERIESGINKSWSKIQVLLYVYDRLKRGIMYDPKYEQKSSYDIRSLRGLLTRQTVCAGYALIFKEFMDRHNIECEFARGGTKRGQISGHAWNIVTIDGKKYPIDLTWDNTTFRSGQSNSFDWLGKNVKEFSNKHFPAPKEKTQDYVHTLSQIDPDIIKILYSQMGIYRAKDYATTTYSARRSNGSRFIVAQIGDTSINGTNYYRFFYADVDKDGKIKSPLILYGKNNLTNFIDYKNFGEPKRRSNESPADFNKRLNDYKEEVKKIMKLFGDILFSEENINDSISKWTYYIGDFRKNKTSNKTIYVTKPSEIDKPENIRGLFAYQTRRYTRSDGSVFVAQKMSKKPEMINGVLVFKYDIFEMVKENGRDVLKRNMVYTEKDFFQDHRQDMVDNYLSRARLDRKVYEAGGYLGYYASDKIRVYNPALVKHFETSKPLDIDAISKKINETKVPRIKIPTFAELKTLATQYEIFVTTRPTKDPAPKVRIQEVKVRDIRTKQVVTDQLTVARALFANLWLAAAGVKYFGNEERPGMTYAFNEPAKQLYEVLCRGLTNSCKVYGVIDTVGILNNIDKYSCYKHKESIIVELFKNPYQVGVINKLFLQSVGINEQKKTPEPLYSLNYAGSLISGSTFGK